MGRDSRNLSVNVDAEHLWPALEAIEDVASEVIEGRDTHGMKCEYKVTHGGGSYHRSAVSEAEAVAQRNGFEVVSIRFAIDKTEEGATLPFDPRLQWIEGYFEYYTPEWKVIKSHVTVKVTENTEVEVNGG